MASALMGQTAFAAAPRAMNAPAVSAPAGKVVGVRQSADVSKTNRGVGLPVLILAIAAGGLGIAAVAGAFDSDDEPASP
ncbi:hypothetical protein [Novosphingobium mangrovi (ex Hu et al. 2023)]|uniref:Uncharacterized protein n=1 Tax=Novosphingobium mangrovi (ex Hu et al. 2023) TaxID=2930094 RepID=A0ABT0AC92_9SPHN|nr:hypothetical protein [Novosphingobium mangrovi (ex Hu et al. 2023)]MCJ1960813.1 hypothetical protein [Novosphingobium mangrovi (ex Hu et al. 2023)]